jgi:hypothetical protein
MKAINNALNNEAFVLGVVPVVEAPVLSLQTNYE